MLDARIDPESGSPVIWPAHEQESCRPLCCANGDASDKARPLPSRQIPSWLSEVCCAPAAHTLSSSAPFPVFPHPSIRIDAKKVFVENLLQHLGLFETDSKGIDINTFPFLTRAKGVDLLNDVHYWMYIHVFALGQKMSLLLLSKRNPPIISSSVR